MKPMQSVRLPLKVNNPSEMVVDLNGTITRTCQTFPGGVSRVEEYKYRIGDYFDNIEFDDSGVTFHLKPQRNSDWKFVAVQVLKKIRNCPGGVIR